MSGNVEHCSAPRSGGLQTAEAAGQPVVYGRFGKRPSLRSGFVAAVCDREHLAVSTVTDRRCYFAFAGGSTVSGSRPIRFRTTRKRGSEWSARKVGRITM